MTAPVQTAPDALDPGAGPRARRGPWYDVGPAWSIPLGEGRVFCVGGVDVAVFRTRAGELFATQPRCPHKGGPLVDGLLGAGAVVCPLHAYRFDLATGAAVGHACGGLTTYPVEVGPTGTIRVLLQPQAPTDR